MFSLSQLIAQSNERANGATATTNTNNNATVDTAETHTKQEHESVATGGSASRASGLTNRTNPRTLPLKRPRPAFKLEPTEQEPTETKEESSDSDPLPDSDVDDDEGDAPDTFQRYAQAIPTIYDPMVSTTTTSPAYLQTLHSFLAPPLPRPFHFRSRLEQLRPRTQLKRQKATRQMQAVTESTEQAWLRHAKDQRRYERSQIRRRWKRRKMDVRDQPDVGGVLLRRTERWLAQPMVQHKLKPPPPSQQVKQNNNSDDNDEDDDSQQEQRQVLDRLTQQSVEGHVSDSATSTLTGTNTTLTATQGVLTEDDDDETLWQGDASVSYQSRWDYWSLGRVEPEWKFGLDPTSVPPQYRLDASLPLEDPDKASKGLCMDVRYKPATATATATTDQRSKTQTTPLYFPPTKSPGHGRYLHYRLAGTLASRYLSSQATITDMENRWIRILLSKVQNSKSDSLAAFAPRRTLRRVIHQLGTNAWIYGKNSWRNPQEVVQMLGLSMESTVLAGRSRYPPSVASFLKSRRQLCVRTNRRQHVHWVHRPDDDNDNNDDDEGSNMTDGEHGSGNGDNNSNDNDKSDDSDDSDDDTSSDSDSDDTSSSSSDKKPVLVKAEQEQDPSKMEPSALETGNRAIVDLTQLSTSHVTGKTGVTIENPVEQAAIDDTVLLPTSTFAHIPGTAPSTPMFPLDPSGIIYGPVDRNARNFQQENEILHSTFLLVLATLLRRRATLTDTDDHQEIQEQIQELLDEYVQTTDSKVYKLRVQLSRGKLRDLPLVQYFHALESYMSYWANGNPSINTTQVIKQDADDLYQDDTDSKNLGAIASHLADFLEKRMRHNGLQRFGSIRVTYALAVVCRRLPRGAAEILSRSINDEDCPTPFHIMQMTLEYLENNDMIHGATSASQQESEGGLRAAELEYLLHNAAKEFERCIKVESLQLDYHLWRIAALAGCLLLCSGNEIGSEARRFPSIQQPPRRGHLPSTDVLPHEIRPQLPKFEEVRVELATAVRILFLWAQHHKGAQLALAIATFLEWKQVVAFLAGDKLDSSLESVVTLHQHHSLQWCHQDPSMHARSRISDPSQCLELLATELENNPSDLERWRTFAGALGCVGHAPDESTSDEDRERHWSICRERHWSICPDCRLMRKPLMLKHRETQNSNEKWWCDGRDWWVPGVLGLSPQKNRRKETAIASVLDALEEALLATPLERPVKDSNAVHAEANSPHDDSLLEWLPSKSSRKHNSHKHSRRERNETYDARLPQVGGKDFRNQPTKPTWHDQELSGFSPKGEVFCYKILILCHLHGVAHQLVQDHVYPVIKEAWDPIDKQANTNGEAFRTLLWLSTVVGMDLSKLFRRKYRGKLREGGNV